MNSTSKKTKDLICWAFYEWGGSSYSSVILTFVFATYFTTSVVQDKIRGSMLWGNTIGLAGLAIAILGPILGAIADCTGRRKRWVGVFAAICIISTALLWFIQPSPVFVRMSIILVTIGIISQECSFIFYSAMLPRLAPPDQIGRWSGLGWGMGYGGGTVCLTLAFVLFINSHHNWFGLDQVSAEGVRATFLLCAAWFFVFSLPLMLFVPDTPGTGQNLASASKQGLTQLYHSLLQVKKYSTIFRFFIARMFYSDGLVTLFAFGGVYAATAFQMDQEEVLLFGISLNITAGLGAVFLALFDDRIGSKKMILLSLIGLTIPTLLCLWVETKATFWGLGMLIGIFAGPVQASSRAFLAKIAPKELENEMFGFFSLSAKATSFIGPLMVGWVTYLTGSSRIGLGSVVIFFVIGGIIMIGVKEEPIKKESRDELSAPLQN